MPIYKNTSKDVQAFVFLLVEDNLMEPTTAFFVSLPFAAFVLMLILFLRLHLKYRLLQKDLDHKSALIRERDSELTDIRDQLRFEQKNAGQISEKLKLAEFSVVQLKEEQQKFNAQVSALHQSFVKELESLSAKIMDQNADKLRNRHQDELDKILKPLSKNLDQFMEKVNASQMSGERTHAELKNELGHLRAMNQQLSLEADKLSKALSGQNKIQGNWGEMMLERILELSGLQKGIDFENQKMISEEDGQRQIPDTLVHLPGNKSLIIDAKVSLNTFLQMQSVDDESQKAEMLQQMSRDIRKHVQGLSAKKYYLGTKNQSPDFVMMFFPLEQIYGLALQNDPGLLEAAWKKNVLIVLPSTLAIALKTIAFLWKTEQQQKNIHEIIRQAGLLGDRFRAFVEDFRKIEKQIDSLRETYFDVHKRLATGKGNLIDRADRLNALGGKIE